VPVHVSPLPHAQPVPPAEDTPDGHAAQFVAPDADAKLPAAQAVQLAEPLALE
jgi:hypothetical protein